MRRSEEGGSGFGLLLYLIKLRYWSDFIATDEYRIVKKVARCTTRCRVLAALLNERRDYEECRDVFSNQIRVHIADRIEESKSMIPLPCGEGEMSSDAVPEPSDR